MIRGFLLFFLHLLFALHGLHALKVIYGRDLIELAQPRLRIRCVFERRTLHLGREVSLFHLLDGLLNVALFDQLVDLGRRTGALIFVAFLRVEHHTDFALPGASLEKVTPTNGPAAFGTSVASPCSVISR